MTTGTEDFGPAEFDANDQGSPLADRAAALAAQAHPQHSIPAQGGAQPGSLSGSQAGLQPGLPPRQQADYARAGYPQSAGQQVQGQGLDQSMGQSQPAAQPGVHHGGQPGVQPGPSQSGAHAIPQPAEETPWLGGGGVGYAEAMFGSGQQPLGSSGPRPRSATQGGVPQQGGNRPTAPQQTAPQQTMPQQSVPQQGVPQQSVPQQSAPHQGIPHQTAPQAMPPQTLPPQSIPHQVAPDQALHLPPQPMLPQPASHDAPTTEFFPGAIFDLPPPPTQLYGQSPQPDLNGHLQQSAEDSGHWTARPVQQPQPVQPVQQAQPFHPEQDQQTVAPVQQQSVAPVQQQAPPVQQQPTAPPAQQTPAQAPAAQSVPQQSAPAAPAASPAPTAQAAPAAPVQAIPRQVAPIQPGLPTQPRPETARAEPTHPEQAHPEPVRAPVPETMAPPPRRAGASASGLAGRNAARSSAPPAPATPSAQPRSRQVPQQQQQPMPQSQANVQPQPQPQPLPEPMLNQPVNDMDLDDADELIVPWQALADPPQPIAVEPVVEVAAAPAETPADTLVEPGVGTVIADPLQHMPQQQTVQQQQTTPQQATPQTTEQAVPMTVGAASEVAMANPPATQEAPTEAAEQAPGEAAPVPRGTRRRSAQQYLADEQDQQPEQQVAQRPEQQIAQPVAQQVAQPVAQLQVPQQRGQQQRSQPKQKLQQTQSQQAQSQQTQQPQPRQQKAAPHDPARAPGYDHETLAAVYRVIHERRDVRNDFLPDEIPTEMLTRILEAAHTAPSVGFSQPWDFLVIRDRVTRESIHDLAVRQRRAYAASLPKARAKAFAALKIEAILDTPINIVVTCDPTRGGRHTLGRYSQPMMAPFSSCLAVENLWLAARAEGLGVGWVSFFDERELAAVLDLPGHVQIVAYLCVGFVKQFPTEPELAGSGWAKRRPLSWAVHEETFGHRALPGAEPISLLNETIDAIRPLDQAAMIQARDRQNRMTKPPGSLGALEAVSEQLAGLAGECPPPMPEPAALAVFAGDHGVHAQGVTPWPQAVTAQMVGNFLAGGAVINAFAKQVGAEVCVVDVGVAADLSGESGLIPRKIRYGTADMTQGPAMSRSEAIEAIEAGIETARDLIAAGNRCLLTGDMGIANTTASAALIATFTGASPAQVTGYGTGIDEQTYAHKVEVVHRALQLHRPDPQDPIGVLAAFGGLEHAALAGFILGAAALRVPVILDGVIAGAAALVAQALAPEVTAACVAGHRSAEPGHALALEALEVVPLIDLELRLGEGSGAALALPLVGAAVRALREVATFDDAGVAEAPAAETGQQQAAAARAAQAQAQAHAQAQGQSQSQPQAQPQPSQARSTERVQPAAARALGAPGVTGAPGNLSAPGTAPAHPGTNA